jgi:hypothetical protein
MFLLNANESQLQTARLLPQQVLRIRNSESGMERVGRLIRQTPDHEGSGERSWS